MTKQINNSKVAYFEGLEIEVLHETEKAFLLDVKGEGFPIYPQMWYPKSAIKNIEDIGVVKPSRWKKADIAKWVFAAWERRFNQYHNVKQR